MDAAEEAPSPELVIGLVGAVGTNLEMVTESLSAALDEVAYRPEIVRLSALLEELDWKHELPEAPLDEHISKHMDAGDELREKWARGDALALIAVSDIMDRRERQTGNVSAPAERCAYVLRSLKHPDEVERFRSVYGRRFILVAAYSPRETRAKELAERIAADRHSMQSTEFLDDAHALIQRDEAEEDRPLGQNVRGTFHLADFFVDARDRGRLERELRRVAEIVFGHPFRTPSRDEHAMFLAEAAAMRSAEMGRQVGAVVATPDGDVVAVGTNEVPRPAGGLYWEGDANDARDFQHGEDTSDAMKRRLVGELLRRLLNANWLSKEHSSATADEMFEAIRGTRVASLIEFGRAVHAEMAALMDAARRGVAVNGCTLFATTFPCHGCARHIVAAGIERVVYIAPYSKSLAEPLHRDAIAIDPDVACGDAVRFEPFVGVAPRSFLDHFRMLTRKDEQGRAKEYSKRKALPRLIQLEPDTPVPAYLEGEELALAVIKDAAESSGLGLRQ